jgi:hypothetical protein
VAPLLSEKVLILPSFQTSADVEWKKDWWFVMGAGAARVSCELMAQLKADGRENPIAIVNAAGYNSDLSWVLGLNYGMPKVVLPNIQTWTKDSVRPIADMEAEAYVLAMFPGAAASFVNAMAAIKPIDPTRWYLSPTLHTPAFLESGAKAVLRGARGVASGTSAGAPDFRAAFRRRWGDAPLDDAYAFYDAGAIIALALERARVQEGAIPEDKKLSSHIVAVTQSGGLPILWNELDVGLKLLRKGQKVEYVGVSGLIQFDDKGLASAPATRWWTIGNEGFEDVPAQSDCR